MNILPFAITAETLKVIAIIIFVFISICYIFSNSWAGYWALTIRNYFIATTVIVLGTISILNIGSIDMHSILATCVIIVPAAIVMGTLGQWIGSIMDNPKNREDADYKLSVLNALKNMDKSITLEELNEKLTKTIEEPDATDESIEEEENES